MADADTIYFTAKVKGNFKSIFPINTGDYEINMI